jgi:hypothetical protein
MASGRAIDAVVGDLAEPPQSLPEHVLDATIVQAGKL